MDDGFAWWLLAGVAGLVLIVLMVRWLRHFGSVVQAERARELFRLQHERFEEALIEAGTRTGKPRGLRWAACLINGEALLVREIKGGAIIALVPVLLNFEPVQGSDMEDVPAAREPRPATAVFAFDRGRWLTVGRVVFNLDPRQTAEKFRTQYALLEHH